MVDTAVVAGAVAQQRSCVGLAFDLTSKHRATDAAASQLEEKLLDHALTQAPENLLDVALLCLVADLRQEAYYSGLNEADQQIFDAVATATLSICGYALANIGSADLRLIPVAMRNRAEELLAEVVGLEAAQEAFA
ncbi:hypothetical protein [uncultured Sphingomonas sp.]|uniref:hypothetical protein n=1 Tax=uncultured Sphingomonas sp. TaxID=158754 RepID=UPI0025FDC6D4|nr:hypothetical protein [uncultured Sphingomonas sp.]